MPCNLTLDEEKLGSSKNQPCNKQRHFVWKMAPTNKPRAPVQLQGAESHDFVPGWELRHLLGYTFSLGIFFPPTFEQG